jgi:hypoxanthine phosphoribosyltransferase
MKNIDRIYRKSVALSLFIFILFQNLLFSQSERDSEMNIDLSKLKLLFSEDDIKNKIVSLANKIDLDYKNKEITVLMVLKGSFIFTSDLIRELNSNITVDVISASSYGSKGTKRGELLIKNFDDLDLKDKDVLVIDDIFDSGNTMNRIVDKIYEKEPSSVKSVTLLLKNTKKRLKDAVLPDYYVYEIEDKFVVGYGLDYKENLRNLKSLYTLN